MDPQPTVRLNNGVMIPQLGLGVFRSASGGEAERAVRTALDVGYRHVDTARIYGNEEDVGRAVRESGVPREQIFVTTKLWNDDHGAGKVGPALEASLRRLGLDHVDLYLIHWPVERLRQASWAELVKLHRDGKCRAIGVSNYTVRHVDEVLAASDVVPAVNQVEWHPFLYQKALFDHCAAKGIALEAYSPLMKGKRVDDPAIGRVAQKLGKTNAQVLIRWSLQRGAICIPKSANPQRIEANFRVFDFTIPGEDMRALDACDEGLRTAWDPTDVR